MLDFEKPIIELEGKITELKNLSHGDSDIDIKSEVKRMETKVDRMLKQTYSKLTPAQKVQVARHQDRPHFLEYVQNLITDFTPLAGDRNYAEDHALIGGLGRFQGNPCVIMGHERGHDTDTRLHHNFGMARPEGYRKSQRLMRMADQFGLPIITLVDTAGAYPGLGAEERGQSEAIARSIQTCLQVKTPIISVIIGEGGSGGAIAIATADKVYMLEHAIYSVISPEGCASILWRSADHAQDASSALKITAQDMLSNGLIDGIIEEPLGGAHRNKDIVMASVAKTIETAMKDMGKVSQDKLIPKRHEKYLALGRAA